jgi:lysophospholipase L1-like esterase
MSSASGNKIFNPSTKWLSCLGDSLTLTDNYAPFVQIYNAYPYVLKGLVGGNCKERNLGIAGNNSTQALARMSDMLRITPTVAVIYIGINDNFQTISTATTQANIQSMINQLKSAGCSRIVLCNIHNIPPSEPSMDAQRTVITNLATSNNLPLCDFKSVTLVAGDYHTDNIHLLPSGLVKLANKLKTTLDAQGWTMVLQN